MSASATATTSESESNTSETSKEKFSKDNLLKLIADKKAAYAPPNWMKSVAWADFRCIIIGKHVKLVSWNG